MIRALLAAAALASAQAPDGGQVINLSCVEALSAVGYGQLAGVFSFVPDKNGSAAFADLIARDAKARKKFVAKVEQDLKETKGVSAWDADALRYTVAIFGSPFGETLKRPKPREIERMAELAMAPALSLAEITARRRAAQ